MPFSSDAEDGPFVLQLHKWQHQFTFHCSEYREAFLSPTRQRLVLLSKQNEAVLLPLVDGNEISYATEISQVESGNTFVDRNGLSLTDCFPVISGVNSLVWGHCPHDWDQLEGSDFSELLVVCGENGPIVHAFRNVHKATRSGTTDVDTPSKWIDWNPLQYMQLRGQLFKSPDLDGVCERECEHTDIEATYEDSKSKDDNFQTCHSMKWFRTFYSEIRNMVSDGTLMAEFPSRESYPHSASVISFSIYESTLSFLKSRTLTDSHFGKKECDISENSDAFSGSFLGSATSVHSRYKCLRVFSSSSCHLLGLVLKSVENNIMRRMEYLESNIRSILVVVIKLCAWGMQWISVMELRDVFGPPAVGSEWQDFQFYDNTLVCLNSVGLIGVWSAISGDFLVCVDLLGSSKVGSCVPLVRSSFSTAIAKWELDQGTLRHNERKVCSKMFKKFVPSHSSLLAVVDDLGVIYVFYANEIICSKNGSADQSKTSISNLRDRILDPWLVGGHGIGSISPMDQQYKNKESPLDPCVSGFTSASQSKGRRRPHIVSVMGLSSLRRVFFPLYRVKEENYNVSPLGITRISNCCNLKGTNGIRIVHSNFHLDSSCRDDGDLNNYRNYRSSCSVKESYHEKESVGCNFQGFLYLISQDGISVLLPSVSISADTSPLEASIFCQPNVSDRVGYKGEKWLDLVTPDKNWKCWQKAVLDRVLLYEGPEEVDCLCMKNGWGLEVSRLRQMDVALHYLNFAEVEQCLNKLVDVHLAEEGILRLLFASIFCAFQKTGSNEEATSSTRLLMLAAEFSTKMMRRYGLSKQNKNEPGETKRLYEMAYFMEIIRDLQSRVSAKRKILVPADDKVHTDPVDVQLLHDDSPLPIVLTEAVHKEASIQANQEPSSSSFMLPGDSVALSTVQSFHRGTLSKRRLLPVENIKDMMIRWEVNNLNIKAVVQDALQSGRIPLAVLQLQLLHLKDSLPDKECFDIFGEVREAGRLVTYDLFMKGETRMAVATLERLGEDVESVLRQLFLRTIRRSLRFQIADVMKKYGYLKSSEWNMLQRMMLIETLYPSSSFWGTYLDRQGSCREKGFAVTSGANSSSLLLTLKVHGYSLICCGEVDGTMTGVWAKTNCRLDPPEFSEDKSHGAYWVSAAAWFDSWDQKILAYIALDQPYHASVQIPWESELSYNAIHNNSSELFKLMDMIPNSLLSEGSLRVNVDVNHSLDGFVHTRFSDHEMFLCASEDSEHASVEVPHVKIFRLPFSLESSSWLRSLVEQKLATKSIFLSEYWHIAEFVQLLSRSCLNIHTPDVSAGDTSTVDPLLSYSCHDDCVQIFHQILVHYSAQYYLPYLLDIYLEEQFLPDHGTLHSLTEAAGNCQWVKWLLFSRINGLEYDASFSNARWSLSLQNFSKNNLISWKDSETMYTVDDMAEQKGEIAALATLMYAPAPMNKCLCYGSVNRNCGMSFQCTVENLHPIVHKFPTLWRTLLSAFSGQDVDGSLSFNINSAFDASPISNYLSWRYDIFSSAGGDTSLFQMLPCWFPKSVRRLVQLYEQGPFGLQLLPRSELSADSFIHNIGNYIIHATGSGDINALSLEASIQKSIERELYFSLEDKEVKLEHHLHRGRAVAAFCHLLSNRATQLRSANANQEALAQPNVQADVRLILAPLTQNERLILLTVAPLAITHFEDSTVVASCAFLLELCGLSASMLRLDIAALQRISSYCKSLENNALLDVTSPRSSVIRILSHGTDGPLAAARALAEDYVKHDHLHIMEEDQGSKTPKIMQTSQTLLDVLRHLEKASLPCISPGKTCGIWLSSGIGDASHLRSQQNEASKRWNMVTEFCQLHHLPLSTKYLEVLANDNDWVGFLTEAHLGGFPVDTVIQVATREMTNPRLKTHVLTVLRNMQLPGRKGNTSMDESSSGNEEIHVLDKSDYTITSELFGIIAECEKQVHPGNALLKKAKDMCWALLAIIASCFPDVTPLSCLAIWLEITAARETSLIMVDDISSKIARSVWSAVEATNALPAESRNLEFRYNRRNPKRRRFMETSLQCPSFTSSTDTSGQQISSMDSTPEVDIFYQGKTWVVEPPDAWTDLEEGLSTLSNLIVLLCEQHLFFPLLRAFEIFMQSCSLLPFIRSLQAFSQMRLAEAQAHLASFSARVKEENASIQPHVPREGLVTTWICSTAVKAAEAVTSRCPSMYEKRCLLQLLAAVDFADDGSSSTYFCRLYWKINLCEPSLTKDGRGYEWNDCVDDAALLDTLERKGCWEQARTWARQLESSNISMKSSAMHHVTETQAEAMVAEWKEFLWDVPQERAALWSHCQALFVRYSFPPLQAGLFFLKHAEAIENEIPAKELHEMLLLSLQWLSGTVTESPPVYPLHLLREIETRVWLLAVESEAQSNGEGDLALPTSIQNLVVGNSSSNIEHTASIITRMDNHINRSNIKLAGNDAVDKGPQTRHLQIVATNDLVATVSSTCDTNKVSGHHDTRVKRRSKASSPVRPSFQKNLDDAKSCESSPNSLWRNWEHFGNLPSQEVQSQMETSFSGWEDAKYVEMEKAVLSLLEFGQVSAAKQLQKKLSPKHVPQEIILTDVAIKLAKMSSSNSKVINFSVFDQEALQIIQSQNIISNSNKIDPLQALESLATKCGPGSGQGLCRRIIAVVKAANVLGLPFSEAFEKHPIDLFRHLCLKVQDSLEVARLFVQTHTLYPPSIARVLSESFLKGLLAAYRGGYIDFNKDEGPAPLLWKPADFLKWAELCPSESEIGHALMRLVMTGQEIPRSCEVELLILSHYFYMSSACLDGVDVLVTFAANRVEQYVLEGDFSCLARLVTGVTNFHSLNFILDILVENGQLELVLQKYSLTDAATSTLASVRGFRLAVLTSLHHFNPLDTDGFSMVYNHFDMKHEAASLLESRATRYMQHWMDSPYRDRQSDELLEAMRLLIEAAEVFSTVDAGQMTHRACARASLLSLQIRIPDLKWIGLSETHARQVFVEQARFQEALIVAEAYGLNQPNEWSPVFWHHIWKPDLIEQLVSEFVVVLPLQPSMLVELSRYYRAEVIARGDQSSSFSVWLSPGGPLGRSFRSFLRRTRDLKLRLQLATTGTGFPDVVNGCNVALDRVPDNVGPSILRRGHGGAYLPLM